MNVKKLEYVVPPVISYLHHAYPLGIIMTQHEAYEWFLNNYIDLRWQECKHHMFNFLVDYDCPWLNVNRITKSQLDSELAKVSLSEYIVSLIARSVYFTLLVDKFYLPNCEYSNDTHFMHEILITGYDSEQETFQYWSFVNDIYKESTCRFTDIVIYDSIKYYGDGVVAVLYSLKQNPQMDLNIHTIYSQLKFYLDGRSLYHENRKCEDYEADKTSLFGINACNCLIDYITDMSNYADLNITYFHVFYEHKKCMRLRMQYLFDNKQNSTHFDKKWLDAAKSIENKSIAARNSALYDNMRRASRPDEKNIRGFLSIARDIIEEEIILLNEVIYQNPALLLESHARRGCLHRTKNDIDTRNNR